VRAVAAAWLAEASKVFAFGSLESVPYQWFWDGHEHMDTAKEAAAQAQRLLSHTTMLATEYARQGKDWETELRQRAKEVRLMGELGLTAGHVLPPAVQEGSEQDEGEEAGAAEKQSTPRAA